MPTPKKTKKRVVRVAPRHKRKTVPSTQAKPKDTLLAWHVTLPPAPNFDPRLRVLLWIGLLAIIGYMVWSKSYVAALTFILIGVVLVVAKPTYPRRLDCAITADAFRVNQETYPFDKLRSFWIFEETSPRLLSLETSNRLIGTVRVPLGKQNPARVRELLLSHLEEKEQTLGLVDTVEKILHI